jgi:hypothetical protein
MDWRTEYAMYHDGMFLRVIGFGRGEGGRIKGDLSVDSKEQKELQNAHFQIRMCVCYCLSKLQAVVLTESSLSLFLPPSLSLLTERICIEDYIALQEIIVPVVVGGILTFLLVVIFVSYIIAYIRRRRKESRQYEPVTGEM